MENFILNRNTPTKEFKLTSKESNLLIDSVSIVIKDDKNAIWTNIASSIQLLVELKYVVYKDPAGRFTEDRTKEFPINLIVAPNQIQPVFILNQRIVNEVFKIGWNTDEKMYTSLKLKLVENNKVNEKYSLHFNVEKHEIE